ncbi:malate dehydrogenase [Candidatus Marsarchaeota G2 archaeon OSP_D]|jgi:Malate/lactate dehydrogenases|uniref:Malate dehydrogenase n=1 Tax=Candidatus Marsarchaeota G2 archaeon OSP_D TaxID=1978157 RepID=A0A2R6AZ58_9ARCH|nr:MAG: malate dehydrogenase [Candidatus Marsarchaeota G2 archaeon OSP_D]
MISIIGSGKIGANVAVHLALRGLDDLTLVDVVQGLPQGEAMDIQHMISAYGIDIEVRGSNDYKDIEGSDLVLVAAGFGRKPGQTRLDLMNSNAGIIRDVSLQIKKYAPECTLVMITNPLDVMTYVAHKLTGFERHRVLGMSGTLDGARLRYFVANELGVATSSVTPMIIGEHGENMLPLAEYTTVGGIPVSHLLTWDKFAQVISSVRGVAAEVIARKGATIHGPAAAVTTLVEAIVKDKHALINASVPLDGEYGYTDVVMDMPVIVGSKGWERIVELKLTESEKAELKKSYDTLRGAIAQLKL